MNEKQQNPMQTPLRDADLMNVNGGVGTSQFDVPDSSKQYEYHFYSSGLESEFHDELNNL